MYARSPKMNTLQVPTARPIKIQPMDASLTIEDDDEEIGLGYQNTLVSINHSKSASF